MYVAKLRPNEMMLIKGIVLRADLDKVTATWFDDPAPLRDCSTSNFVKNLSFFKDKDGNFLVYMCPAGCLLISEEHELCGLES